MEKISKYLESHSPLKSNAEMIQEAKSMESLKPHAEFLEQFVYISLSSTNSSLKNTLIEDEFDPMNL